jgi:hypothetical protein
MIEEITSLAGRIKIGIENDPIGNKLILSGQEDLLETKIELVDTNNGRGDVDISISPNVAGTCLNILFNVQISRRCLAREC